MSSFRALSPVIVLVSLILASCTGSARMASTNPSGEVSPKLNPFIYYEEGKVLFVGVDVRAAQFIEPGSDTIFPLGLGMVNRSNGSLSFDRESFVLETAAGKRYPLVSVQEYNRDYSRSPADRRMADEFVDILTRRYGTFEFVDRPLFPYRGTGATASNSFELGNMFWTHMYLYFPVPEDGLKKKRFKLLVAPKEKDEPLVVDFETR